jgi:hypothetical protein
MFLNVLHTTFSLKCVLSFQSPVLVCFECLFVCLFVCLCVWFVLLNDVGTSWPAGYVETQSSYYGMLKR